MAGMRPLVALLMIFVASPLILGAVLSTTPDEPKMPTSTISAAPALLPDSPLASPPGLSPDITPLFPSPGGSELSPSESSMPTIPSSPSPPNPDAMAAPGPVKAFSPFGALPVSSSRSLHISGFLTSAAILPGLLALWLVQLSGV